MFSNVYTPQRQISLVSMKSGGQAKATRPVPWLSPPPTLPTNGSCGFVVFQWRWRTWNMSAAMFPLEREVSSSLEGGRLMSRWSPLSQVALSYENRWMYQAPSQTASKCQPWCTQMAFPRQREWACEVVRPFHWWAFSSVSCNLIRWLMCFLLVYSLYSTTNNALYCRGGRVGR